MKLFACEGIRAGYGDAQVLREVSFSIESGSLTGLLGANGCGKTTLIRAICGILPHRGRCRLADVQLEQLRARELAALCRYIPQRSGISIDLSLMDVVLMGFNPQLGVLQRPNAAMRSAALEALECVGLRERAQESYLTLSEGQKQLCILARTLASGGRMLLLDEPESALDFSHRFAVLKLVKDWIARDSRCALVALHDPQLALNCCDQLVLLKDGKVSAVLQPRVDPLADMEAALRGIYGDICLQRCTDRRERPHLVMLKEGFDP